MTGDRHQGEPIEPLFGPIESSLGGVDEPHDYWPHRQNVGGRSSTAAAALSPGAPALEAVDRVRMPPRLAMPARVNGGQRSAGDENEQLRALVQELESELAALRQALTRATCDSLTDPLTGLANRRAFDDAMAAAMARASLVSPGQLLIADIDHFKVLNDSHGHHFGDAVLRITGEVLKASVRRGTLVARLGGDEFALLLPGPSAAYPVKIETAAIAERLCARIAQRPLTVRGHPACRERITLSIGLAGWCPGECPADWYARADAALYAAKRSGRNRVVVAEATNGCRTAASSARHSRESR